MQHHDYKMNIHKILHTLICYPPFPQIDVPTRSQQCSSSNYNLFGLQGYVLTRVGPCVCLHVHMSVSVCVYSMYVCVCMSEVCVLVCACVCPSVRISLSTVSA